MQDRDNTVDAVNREIRGGLRGLAASIRFRVLLRGLGWIVAAACAAAWVSFVLDYGLYRLTMRHLELTPRLIVSAACLCAVGVVAWKRLLRSVFRSFADEDLAVLVEKGHPQLQDRLISALQFSHESAAGAGESPALVDKVIEEAGAAARSVNFLSVLRMEPVRSALLAAAALALLTGGCAFLAGRTATAWAERNLLFDNAKYPRLTVLKVEGGRVHRVVRGELLRITVTVEPGTVPPRDVEFHMKFPSIGEANETIPISVGGNPMYVKVFPVVTEPFRFFVSGNDDQTDEIKVETAEPPELRDMELEVRSPLYTGLAPRKVRRGAGMVDVPEGGVVALSGLATKDLNSVRILLDDTPIRACRIGGSPRRQVQGEFPVVAPVPFRPSMSLKIELNDTDGFVNPKAAAYRLILRQDQPPSCVLEAVDIGGEITSNAVINFNIATRDDYGVAGIHLEWGVQSAVQNTIQYALKAFIPATPEPELLRSAFDLRIAGAEGASNTPPLQIGETLRVRAVATDSRPAASGGPQKTPSDLLTFRIVTAEDLMAKAMDAKRSVREQIRQAIEMQTENAERTRNALKDAAQTTTIGIAQREIGTCLEAENQVGDFVSNSVTRLQTLLEQLKNNRAVSPNDELWLRASVISPLKKLSADAIPSIAQGFSLARSLADPARLIPKLAELVKAQEQLIREMEAIVSEMTKFEDAQQVEKGLRAIIRLSDQVRDAMKPGKAPKSPDESPAPEKKNP